jgi:hypothetical protein
MKTKTTLLAVFGAVLLAIGVTSVVLISLDDTPKNNQAKTTEQKPVQTEEDADTVRFTAEADKNVLEQLKLHADVVTKDSQYGAYVDSINGKVGGDGGKYWTFYVDGEMAQVGAEAYITKGGETIEWKFE